MSYFNKILIANRGEIAVRVARTARRLGIKTVAVFSDADKGAPHVRACDEAIHIGASPATESYLVADKIIAAAKRTGAEAIHPGYGFLSENSEFARALDRAGIVFIGPTAETIESMGSKSAAKDLMEAAGVPVAPGYQGASQSLKTFTSEAKRIGYPVLLKATAGGGGKGMRLVQSEAELAPALKAAKREAKSAFGDDRFLIEKYIARARHLEVQIFGDGNGNVVHLFERDCSVQRRHQKIIEEAPAPDLAESVRERLLKAGVEAGKAVSYRGAGTVEFLYDGGDNVYFMEMNTRLQVEHPVSEMITGQDLVEWQLRVAAEQGLPLGQDEISAKGHAFEARLYAEDPQKSFSPSIGKIQALKLPYANARVDAGVVEGQEVTPHYDPMIAKIITHGPTRSEALSRLRRALDETRTTGLQTNAAFLARLSDDSDFKSGRVSTRYIEDNSDTLFAETEFEDLALAAFAFSQTRERNRALGFRLNQSPRSNLWARISDQSLFLSLSRNQEQFTLHIRENDTAAARRGGETASLREPLSFEAETLSDSEFAISLDGARRNVSIHPHLDGVRVFNGAQSIEIENVDPLTPSVQTDGGASSLNAPMPGVILNLFVSKGDMVRAGDPLLSMEAMKMEHTVNAPYDGRVEEVYFTEGDQVSDGAQLINLESFEDEPA